MKIEAGKFYLDAEGNKRGPMEWSDHGELGGFYCNSVGLFRADGTFGYGSIDAPALNLIAEWHDEPTQPETSTLAELNVKPGDVVVTVDNPDNDYIGMNCTINSDGIAESDCGLRFFPCYDNYYGRTYRIISRASQSTTPVAHSTTLPRTVTTHGTWTPHGPKPKTQYVYSMTFDIDTEGHPIWSSAKVTGR